MNDSFRFQMNYDEAEDCILRLGSLSALVDGKVIYSWTVTSGIPGHQGASNIWDRGKGLIPPSEWVAKPYVLGLEKTHSDNFKAVGEFIYTIWPLIVWGKYGQHKRSNFGLHFDANHATSPGSGGCIVAVDETVWESLQAYLDNLFAEGIKEVPLEIVYT